MGETPRLLQYRGPRKSCAFLTPPKTDFPLPESISEFRLHALSLFYFCRVQDAEGFESPGSAHSTPSAIDSPSPSDNLSLHPYFRKEFALPYDEALDTIISSRRMRDSVSVTSSSSPSPPPPPPTKGRRGGRRGRGSAPRPPSHVAAESDSSVLTLESGDESVAPTPTPKGSVNTGSDAGTDYGEDEDVEVAASPGTQLSCVICMLFPLSC
jgi:MRG-binding protein